MALGGFIQDNTKKFNQQRKDRKAKRQKFNGNYSEDAILKTKNFDKIEFAKLSKLQVEEERSRIAERFQKRRNNGIVLLVIGLVATLILTFVLLEKSHEWGFW